MPISRRDFLKSGLVLTGGALLPRWAVGASGPAPDVIHVTGGGAERGVRAAIDALGGIGRFVRRGQKVVISPNVGFPNPAEMATTTDPAVVKAVIDLCKSAGAGSITVANFPVRDPDACFEHSGIGALGRLNGVNVVPLNAQSAYETVAIANGVDVKDVEIATVVRQVAKSHSSAGVSFAMKGMMGLIRSRGPFHSRYDFHQAVVDLNKIIVPTLVVTDAQRALVTRGPGGPGRVETPNSIVAGRIPATVDAYTVGLARWYNRDFTAAQVRHLQLANEQGLGEIDVAKMRVRRMTIAS